MNQRRTATRLALAALAAAALLLAAPPAAPAGERPAADDAAALAKLKGELARVHHKILFETYVEDNWEIFIMNADGTGKRNLTRTPEVHEMYPQASRDGTKICFLQDTPDGDDTLRCVCWMKADGSGRKLVAAKARQPCWSPDGTKIAFVRQEFTRFRVSDFASKGIFIYDLETGRTTQHPNHDIHHLYTLNWAANGKWFVSTIHAGMGFGHAILAIPAAGHEVYNLGIPGCRPNLDRAARHVTWSPGDHQINVADIEFAPPRPVVKNAHPVDRRKKLHLYHPDLSPDARYVVYSVGPGGRVAADGPGTQTGVAEMVGVHGKWNLYLKPVSGKGPALQLTFDASRSNKESEWLPASPTGTRKQ